MNAPLLPALPGYDNPQLIAHGTTALVFLATQTRLNRPVAIKVITADTGSVPVNAARELATTVALSSQPHIISIIDTGVTEDDRPYIVMEYCEGGSYAQILRHDGLLPVDDVLEVGIKIGEALHAAHQAGIVHRDVKPSNILRSRFGPALTDFGIARAPDELGGTLTREMMTPHHASPEALLHQAQSGISDIYSLASTMWTLLIGHPPFVDPTRPPLDMYAFRDRVLHDPLPPMTRDDAPTWLIGELNRAMSKLPAQRHGSALEFAEALRRGALGLSPAPKPPPAATPPGDANSGAAQGGDKGQVHVPGVPAQAWPAADPTPIGMPPAKATSFRDPAPAIAPAKAASTPTASTPAAGAAAAGALTAGSPAANAPTTVLHAPAGIATTGEGSTRPGGPEDRATSRTAPAPDPRAQTSPQTGLQTAAPGRQAGLSRTPLEARPQVRPEPNTRPRPESGPPARPDLDEEPGGPDEGGWLGPAGGWRSTPDATTQNPLGNRHFDKRDLVPPPSGHRGTMLAVVIGVAVLAIAGAAVLILTSQRDSSTAQRQNSLAVSALPTRFISAQASGQPRDTRITDDRGTSVTVSWTDPTAGGTVSFVVVGTGPSGEKLETKSVRRGTTTAMYSQLNPKKNYCFVVGAVYAVDAIALATEVCTKR